MLVTIPKAAEALALHQATLRRWIKDGLVPYVRLPSGRVRLRRDDLSRLTESRENEST